MRELLDELLSGVERPEDLLGDKGLDEGTQGSAEWNECWALNLPSIWAMNRMVSLQASNPSRRNGAARKVLKGNDGAVPIDIPRDRDGSFEPELIQKGQTRIDGMDDKIIGLYAAGLSTRDIRAHLEEVYG